MHISSYNLMEYFVKKYLLQNSIVLDFGGSNSYHSYKTIMDNHNSIYKTLDWDDADYVVKGYDWSSVPKKYFDAVISGQAFEHDLYFWKTTENIKNVIKKEGLVIIIVPTKGDYHQYPIDCYRFYPDSALVFADILNADIIEVIWNNILATTALRKYGVENTSILFTHQFDTDWGDLGMVFKINK